MLAVRWLHLLGAALALGGATLAWWLFRSTGLDTAPVAENESGTVDASEAATASAGVPALAVAAGYERLFWAATGVLVMTGVGNLGSLAPYVPGTATPWGTAFVLKLALVLAVLALSLVRTLVVHRYRRADELGRAGRRRLRRSYGATALAFAALVALAEVLAHG